MKSRTLLMRLSRFSTGVFLGIVVTTLTSMAQYGKENVSPEFLTFWKSFAATVLRLDSAAVANLCHDSVKHYAITILKEPLCFDAVGRYQESFVMQVPRQLLRDTSYRFSILKVPDEVRDSDKIFLAAAHVRGARSVYELHAFAKLSSGWRLIDWLTANHNPITDSSDTAAEEFVPPGGPAHGAADQASQTAQGSSGASVGTGGSSKTSEAPFKLVGGQKPNAELSRAWDAFREAVHAGQKDALRTLGARASNIDAMLSDVLLKSYTEGYSLPMSYETNKKTELRANYFAPEILLTLDASAKYYRTILPYGLGKAFIALWKEQAGRGGKKTYKFEFGQSVDNYLR